MKRQLAGVMLLLVSLAILWPAYGHAFCGFYVARADSSLYNSASQVVVARDEDKTVLTMVNNYKGDLKEFALVVPVPVVLEREMVRVTDPKVVTHLDAYSAPRLVEYFDPDPCNRPPLPAEVLSGAGTARFASAARQGTKPWASLSKPSTQSESTTSSSSRLKSPRAWKPGSNRITTTSLLARRRRWRPTFAAM